MFKKTISIVLICTLIISAFSVTAGALCDTTVLYGDVNLNGKLDISDARLALKMAAGIEPELPQSEIKKLDINGDGIVSIYDARQILKGASGIVSLQPTGKFSGFEGYENENSSVKDATQAIFLFNNLLNRIKSEKPGFTKTQTKILSNFSIKSVNFIGMQLGQSAESVTKIIESAISKANKPEEAQILLKGQNCDNIISAETENYVSKLNETTDNIFGVRCNFNDITKFMVISVALPDVEVENINDSAYGDVFNGDVISKSNSKLIDEIFGKGVYVAATRNGLKNGVLTAVVDSKTGNVVSYTTTYETDMYIEKSRFEIGPLLTAELDGVSYGTIVTTTYSNFQW